MNRDALAAQLKIDEDVRKYLYVDSMGHMTGGVGHNFDAKGLSPAAIDLILNEDIDDACRDLDNALPWWRQLSDRRQQVLANMCFNLGIRKLLGFPKMLAALQAARYDEAATEMEDSAWWHQVGDRAKRLQKMMRDG